MPGRGVLAAHTVLAEAVDARRMDVADVEPPPGSARRPGASAEADPDRGARPRRPRPAVAAGGLDPDGVVPVAPGGASALADLLDLPLAGAGHHGEVRSPGVATRWTDLPARRGVGGRRGTGPAGREVVVHARLRVAVADDDRARPPREVFPGVWVDDAGCTPTTRCAACSPPGPSSA